MGSTLVQNSELFVSVPTLVEFGAEPRYTRYAISIKRWKVIDHPINGKMVAYNSISEKYKELHSLPTESTLLSHLKDRQAQLDFLSKGKEYSTDDDILEALETTSTEGFKDFFLKASLSSAEALKYTRLAKWLTWLAGINHASQWQAFGFAKKAEFQTHVMGMITGEQLPNFKVRNLRKLQEKVSPFRAWQKEAESTTKKHNALRSIISQKRKGTVKGGYKRSDEHVSIVMTYWANPGKAQKFDQKTVIKKSQAHFKRVGLPMLGETTIKQIIAEYKHTASAERDGSTYAKNTYEPRVHRRKPGHSLRVVHMDGTRADLNVKVAYTDDKGNEKSQHYLNYYIAVDVATGAIMGWSLGLRENHLTVQNCMKNLMNRTGWRKPHQIFRDGGSANTHHHTAHIMRSISAREPQGFKSSRENYAERVIGRINYELRNLEQWNGMNITVKEQRNKNNPDYVNWVLPLGKEDAAQALANIIEGYNLEQLPNGKTRIDAALENIDPTCQELEQWDRVMLFDNRTTVTPGQAHFKITVGGLGYIYEVKKWYQLARKLKGKEVAVYYNADDLENVLVCLVDPKNRKRENDRYECTAVLSYGAEFLPEDQTHESAKSLASQVKEAREFGQQREADMTYWIETFTDLKGSEADLVAVDDERKERWNAAEASFKADLSALQARQPVKYEEITKRVKPGTSAKGEVPQEAPKVDLNDSLWTL